MSLPKSIHSYVDIVPVLDTALRHERWPATFSCSSPSAARYWRMRAYSLRALLRRDEERRFGIREGMGTSDYDLLVITLDGPTVIINKREAEAVGTLICGGEPVEVRANDAPAEYNELAERFPEGQSDDSDPFDL